MRVALTMIHRDTIISILGDAPKSMDEILAIGNQRSASSLADSREPNAESRLVREDVQFVLRHLIADEVVKALPPEADGVPWKYELREPLFANV